MSAGRSGPDRGRGRRLRWAAIPIVALALLAVESGWGVHARGDGTLEVTASTAPSGGLGATITLQLHSTAAPLDLRVGLVSADRPTTRPDRLFVLADPLYPGPYTNGGVATLEGDAIRIASYLATLGNPIPVETISGSAVRGDLTADPNAAFAVIGLPAPDTVLSNSTWFLADWVRSGGLLIWAGGPLGYAAGHPGSGGSFDYANPGWYGQELLAGYPVTDPAPVVPLGTPTKLPPPPLDGTSPSPLASALSTQYYATPAGANVTGLARHGGLDLGLISAPGAEGPAAPRTSIAYLPLGHGGILFFGGADASGYVGYEPYAQGWITDGTAVISLDIALWLGLGAVPTSSYAASLWVSVGPLGTTSCSFAVPDASGTYEWIVVDLSDSVLLVGSSGVAPPG
ncbi:MAG: hypothetical protein L3K19_03375 [Thermoplasmata archaeon]|nr:hypothetical protein [Thermoplasmata archaeon]